MRIDQITQQIIRDEGFQGKPYVDTRGKTTIAYGLNLDDAPLTPEEGAMITEVRLLDLHEKLAASLPWIIRLDEAREGVLLNMAYQLGLGGLLGFRRTLSYVEQGDYALASAEMLDSNWAEQTPTRARRLSEQMRTGEWQ